MTTLRSAMLVACAALGACRATIPPAGVPALPGSADSIVLERTRCYGTCPAYRLSLAATGRVAFTSHYPDEGRSETGRTSPDAFRRLLREAEAAGFFVLPDTIANDPALCASPRTDSPTVTVAVFAAAGAKQVVHYRGCGAPDDPQATRRLAALRELEARIDSTAGSGRWVRQPVR
ncbi:MAG TPA: DUF6438 domain-containing protein [Longimicrobiaceae bacterium]|nr:DUF6438 domain-containing protein [Longimicrobiaceae bacterium]